MAETNGFPNFRFGQRQPGATVLCPFHQHSIWVHRHARGYRSKIQRGRKRLRHGGSPDGERQIPLTPDLMHILIHPNDVRTYHSLQAEGC